MPLGSYLNFTGQTNCITFLSGWSKWTSKESNVTRLCWKLVLNMWAFDHYRDSIIVIWRLYKLRARYVWTCTVSCFNFARCGVHHHYQRIQVKQIKLVKMSWEEYKSRPREHPNQKEQKIHYKLFINVSRHTSCRYKSSEGLPKKFLHKPYIVLDIPRPHTAQQTSGI